jgi:hypothetical protein
MTMKFHIVVRTNRVTRAKEVCVGSSPLTGNPYWSAIGVTVLQPLLLSMNNPDYANFVLDTARNKDEYRSLHDYTLGDVEITIGEQA